MFATHRIHHVIEPDQTHIDTHTCMHTHIFYIYNVAWRSSSRI